MVKQAVGRVGHRPDHRELVVDFRQVREDFGELDTWNFRIDWLKNRPYVVGNVRFGVPEVEVRRAAL